MASDRDRRKHGDPFPLPSFDLQRQLNDQQVCMPQRGPWICNTLSKLAIPEFNQYKQVDQLAPTVVQETAIRRIRDTLIKAAILTLIFQLLRVLQTC